MITLPRLSWRLLLSNATRIKSCGRVHRAARSCSSRLRELIRRPLKHGPLCWSSRVKQVHNTSVLRAPGPVQGFVYSSVLDAFLTMTRVTRSTLEGKVVVQGLLQTAIPLCQMPRIRRRRGVRGPKFIALGDEIFESYVFLTTLPIDDRK